MEAKVIQTPYHRGIYGHTGGDYIVNIDGYAIDFGTHEDLAHKVAHAVNEYGARKECKGLSLSEEIDFVGDYNRSL